MGIIGIIMDADVSVCTPSGMKLSRVAASAVVRGRVGWRLDFVMLECGPYLSL